LPHEKCYGAVAARYRAAGREEKKEILDEFVKVTGFHRKHAISHARRRFHWPNGEQGHS